MAAAKKAAAPKAAPKPKVPAAPQAPQAEATAALAGPASDADSDAPGADQAGDGGEETGEADEQAASGGLQTFTMNHYRAELRREKVLQSAELVLDEGEVAVSCVKGLDRFYRAGMRFTRLPSVLVSAELGEGVLERLKAEPNLIVVES